MADEDVDDDRNKDEVDDELGNGQLRGRIKHHGADAGEQCEAFSSGRKLMLKGRKFKQKS